MTKYPLPLQWENVARQIWHEARRVTRGHEQIEIRIVIDKNGDPMPLDFGVQIDIPTAPLPLAWGNFAKRSAHLARRHPPGPAVINAKIVVDGDGIAMTWHVDKEQWEPKASDDVIPHLLRGL